MVSKTTIEMKDFFDKLIKYKCRFKKRGGIYPASCKNIKYIGQRKDFKNIEVFTINDKEEKFFNEIFKLFGEKCKIEILLNNN
jgi:hypothetical protein